MSQRPSKVNQAKLGIMLAQIRTAKLDIKDKINELQIRKESLTSRPRPFQNEQNMDDKDLNALCGGLQLLQRETAELWN
jgi:hypothetical protein